MIQITNLIYKEDDEARCFISENFNFIYSKIDNTSCSWGKSKDETPNYNPISPETIIMKIDDNFLFYRDEILKLISMEYKNSECVSCVTSIILEGDVKNIFNNDEVKKLICYINSFNIVCFIKINFISEFTLKDIFKIKYLNCKNIILNISNEIKINELLNSINILTENEIIVNCEVSLNSKNIDSFINLISNNYNLDILTTINFIKPNIKKDKLNELSNIIQEKQLVNIIVNKEINSRKKYEIKNKIDEDGLFSCIIDFTKNIIYCEKFKENFVNFNDVKKLSDYWNSKQFNDVRRQLIKGF